MEKIVLGDDPDVKGGVYVLRIGRWFYFGKSRDLRKRYVHHLWQLRNGRHKNVILQRTFNRHGEGELSFEPIAWCGLDEASRIEADLIQACKDIPTCANLRLEDGKTYSHSDETRNRMSLSLRGRKLSPEHCEKIRERCRRFRHTEESKKKMGWFWRGRPRGKDFGRRVSAALSGRKLSEEHCKKIGDLKRGVKQSEESRKKKSETIKSIGHKPTKSCTALANARRRTPTLIVTPEGESLYFLSASDAARHIGVEGSDFRAWIKGQRKPFRRFSGYRFSYLDKTKENWSIFPTACTHEHYEISGK